MILEPLFSRGSFLVFGLAYAISSAQSILFFPLHFSLFLFQPNLYSLRYFHAFLVIAFRNLVILPWISCCDGVFCHVCGCLDIFRNFSKAFKFVQQQPNVVSKFQIDTVIYKRPFNAFSTAC